MPSNTIPQTQNREWGFFGTMAHHADPERAWDIALAFIAGTTGCSADATRAFLDSRHGRHFADEVSNTSRQARGWPPRSTPRRRSGWAGASAPAPPTKPASPAGFPT